MPGGNFDDTLKLDLSTGVVDAMGPLDPSVTKVVEMCVWVLQRNGAGDAVANAMGGPGGGMAGMAMPGKLTVDIPAGRWTFGLPLIGDKTPLRHGSAFAVAIAVVADSNRHQKALQWGEPVELVP